MESILEMCVDSRRHENSETRSDTVLRLRGYRLSGSFEDWTQCVTSVMPSFDSQVFSLRLCRAAKPQLNWHKSVLTGINLFCYRWLDETGVPAKCGPHGGGKKRLVPLLAGLD